QCGAVYLTPGSNGSRCDTTSSLGSPARCGTCSLEVEPLPASYQSFDLKLFTVAVTLRPPWPGGLACRRLLGCFMMSGGCSQMSESRVVLGVGAAPWIR